MRTLLWLLLVLAVALTACTSSGDPGTDEAEVEGVLQERETQSPAADTTPSEPRTIRPTQPDTDDEQLAAEEPDGDGDGDEPRPEVTVTVTETRTETRTRTRTVTETETVREEPQEQPREEPGDEPTPRESPTGTEPRLDTRDGWSYVLWQPADGSDGDWWSEASAHPPISRDDPEAAESEPVRVRLEASDGSDGSSQVRQATCRAWIIAPEDHGWHVRGRLTVTLLAGNTGKIIQRYDLDRVVAAGETFEVRPTTPQAVDAADGRDVTCDATFDAR